MTGVLVACCWLLVTGFYSLFPIPYSLVSASCVTRFASRFFCHASRVTTLVIPAKAGIPAFAGMTVERSAFRVTRHASRVTFIALAIAVTFGQKSSAQTGLFVPRDFGRYHVSDIYAPVTNLQVGLGTNSADYNTNWDRQWGYIILEDFTLGADLPVFSGQFMLAGKPVRMAVTGSLSAMVWFDFTNINSAPILNVDYRAGFPELHFLREFDSKIFRNLLLRFIPLQHESTHIGDELLLFRQEVGFSIKRINVSYQSWETSLTLNDPALTNGINHSVGIGAKILYQIIYQNGYYTMRPVEGEASAFVPSSRRMEWYLRYQLDAPAGPFRSSRFYPVISAELRYRVRYGYPYQIANEKTLNGFTEVPGSEIFAPCLNLYAGFRDKGASNKPGWGGVYLRYYTGINPHGQFRNIPKYNFLGISLIFND